MIIDKEFVIDHPVDSVFSLMADIEKRPQWVESAQSREKLTEGPVGVGTRFRAVDKYPGRRAHFTQEIIGYEPNRLLAESWDGPLGGTSVFPNRRPRRFDETPHALRDEADGDARPTLPRS